ncbi:MAG: hypothetical protein MUF30_06445 [Burkholderiales bacterium]|jgi:TPR repeat protein|nr:hypothetical protein [Burkholderiales bacterium]
MAAAVLATFAAPAATAIEYTPAGRIEGMRCGGMPVNMIDRNACDALRAFFARWMPRAQRCDAEARWRVGERFLTDRQTAKVGVAWLERAAQQGYPPAQRTLADALERGRGVPADPVGAAAWWQIAAAAGDADAARARDRLAGALDAAQAEAAAERARTWVVQPCGGPLSPGAAEGAR